MPHGDKTKSLAMVAAGALPLALIDISGVAAATFLVAGTGAIIGSTYHGGKKLSKFTKQVLYTKLHKGPQSSPAYSLSTSIESCVRKLSSSFTGVIISSTLVVVMPHHLATVALNAVQFVGELRIFRDLMKEAGGAKQLLHHISWKNISLQITTGIIITLVASLLTMGHDFTTVLDGLKTSRVITVMDKSFAKQADDVGKIHDTMIDHGLLKQTTEIANKPGDMMAKALGHEGDWNVTWKENEKFYRVAGVGVANAAGEFVAGKVLESPAHDLIDETRRRARRV